VRAIKSKLRWMSERVVCLNQSVDGERDDIQLDTDSAVAARLVDLNTEAFVKLRHQPNTIDV